MNNLNQRPLQERADGLRSWLKERLRAIREARSQRAEDFRAVDSAIAAVEKDRREISEEIDQAKATIADRKAKIESLMTEIEMLEENIQIRRDMIDSLTDVIFAHEKRLEPIRKKWAGLMRSFQDGKVRRRRAELAKVDRRIQAKQERAERAAMLKEPLTAEEIGMGITFEEKLARQQRAEEGDNVTDPQV